MSRAVDGGTARLLPDLDRKRAWLLTVEGAPQSYVDLDDPRCLEFEYAQRLGHLLDLAGPSGPLDVLHLGGGGLTLPRYVTATRPGSRQRVVEADEGLLDLVAELLPLPPASGIELLCGDARAVLDTEPAGSADVIVADVYGGARVPAGMTTVSCARAADRVLRPDGLWAANLADAAPFAFLGSQLATFGTVFRHLCVVAEPAVLRGRRFGNILLLAGQRELPLGALARRTAGDPFPARVVHGAELDGLAADAQPVRDGAAVPSPQPPEGAFSLGSLGPPDSPGAPG
ncbi:fused MFS/spermidine synthase [Streptomyces sp. JJ36]|nr:fused MFS/spermidine synthase [Streptomyces sp. JJ36]